MREAETGFINTHNIIELKKEFGKLKVPGTKLGALLDAAVSAVPDTAAEKVNLKGFKKLLRGFIEQRRVKAAAWRWIKPDPVIDIDRLDALRVKLSLNHLTRSEVAERMSEQCRILAEANPRLSRWVDARIADLEYIYKTARKTDAIKSPFELFQRQLVVAAARPNDPDAQRGLDALVPTSIAAAAAETRLVLDDSDEQCPFHANLMVAASFQGSVADVPDALGALGKTDGAQEAAKLWEGLIPLAHRVKVHRVLVVVSETAESHYRGFWIPDVRIEKATLPGAPRALFTGIAQKVVVDDLPPFPIRNLGNDVDNAHAAIVEARWKDYLRGAEPGLFQGAMFVSIPVFKVVENNQPLPCAVLNVNVVSDRIWNRAYSRHWVNRATRRVAAWASTAWHATALASEPGRSNLSLTAPLDLPMLGAGDFTEEHERARRLPSNRPSRPSKQLPSGESHDDQED